MPSISSPASEFLGKIKYLNTLPEVPVEAMFLTIPLDLDRYVPYRYSSLEKNTKNDISYSIKDTIPLPLVDLSVYPTPEMATRNLQSPELLHPADLLLLSLGAGTEVAATDSKRDAVLSTIATDFTIKKHAHANFNFKQSVSRFSNAAHSMPIKEFGRNMTVEKAKEVIEQTFLDAQHDTLIKLEHPLTPELTVKKILPVLPDRASWPDEYYYKFKAENVFLIFVF